MNIKICAVRDRAIDEFGQPIFVRAIGQAIRSFTDEINREGSEMGQHPEDYDLYEIGDWNGASGAITTPTTPRMLAIGKDVKRNPIE